MEKKKPVFHYAWLLLIALCVIRSLSAAGINNTGGLFLKPVSEQLGIGIGSLSVYFSVSSVATLIFMPIGGRLINRVNAKTLISVAVILQAGSFAALGYMNSVWAWYILSIPIGVGGAVIVNLIGPILINRWFQKYSGMALGILMACVGLFGAIIQPMLSRVIADRGWRFSYVVLGVLVFLVVEAVNLLFIKNSPGESGLEPLGASGLNRKDGKDGEGTGVSFGQVKKERSFYMLLLFMVSITAFGAFNQHMANYGAELGYEASKVGTVLSISMIGSTIGAVFIGIISDRAGAFLTTLGILGVAGASIFCLMFGGKTFFVFALGGFLLGLGAMGIPVLAPLLTKNFFGEKDYEQIYSSVMMGAPLATILLLPLYGFIYDRLGSYRPVFYLMGGLIVLGVISILIGDRSKPKMEDKGSERKV